jgi:hypothetical protein
MNSCCFLLPSGAAALPALRRGPPAASSRRSVGPARAWPARRRAVVCSAAIRPLRDPPPRFNAYLPTDVESVRVRHVRVHTRELAVATLAAISSGDATLTALAEQLSTCAASRGRGGDLGWWDVGEAVPGDVEQFGMCDELLGAAVRTRPNAVDVIETRFGFHVYVVEDVRHKLQVVRTRTASAPPRRRRRSDSDFPDTVPMSYHIQSLGCQMNQADKERCVRRDTTRRVRAAGTAASTGSDCVGSHAFPSASMASCMDRLGYSWEEDEFASSVLILNTCSIRAHAEDKVYSALGRHAARKHASPGKVTLCVAGCVAQQEGEALLRRVPELDLVMGPQYAGRIGDLLKDVELNQCQVAATKPVHIHEDLSKPVRESKTTAWVNIIYGCNEVCSARGRRRARPLPSARR